MRFLTLAFFRPFLYLSAMFKLSVIILSIIWASLLLISWGGAENPPEEVQVASQVQGGF